MNDQAPITRGEFDSAMRRIETVLEKQTQILSQMAADRVSVEQIEERVDDHETRLRGVEATDLKFKGVAAVASFVGFPTLALLVYLVATKAS